MKRPQRELSIGVWVDNSQILAPKLVPGNLGSTGLLVIPQVDGTTLPIKLKEPSEASKILGVRAAPDGNPVAHLAHMKKCGLDWGDKLHTTYLPGHLVWMSHSLQFYPQMSYDLECLLATPKELSKEMRKVIRHCLSPLGVNRNIKSEFTTISHKY